ncbi:hypothetical protein SRABI111_00713 [Pseudomonas carnis]|nr:hypothetical protein SRABI08_00470 [Pseudomonas carnis]CAH0151275.1 hypothetical protein SRABI111_00713 [Pseudomonas carnis]CAH0210997.1 hypothetical protein SRABI64_01979 [Pseudomonas carnis]CAH0224154.1 hypothetical protein SRABI110_02561 [Pseudomonas carnis]
MKCIGDWRCFFLSYSLSDTRFQLADLSLNFVQGPDVVPRFFGDLAFVGRVQVEELAAWMIHAADLRDAQFKACLVASEVVADCVRHPSVRRSRRSSRVCDPHEPDNTQFACGCQLQRIGEDVSEKLNYTPGLFTVEQRVRGKWACRQYETLIQAPVPAQKINKGIPTASL